MTENDQIIQRFHSELLSNGNHAAAEELLAPNVVHHGHQTLHDRESVLQTLNVFHEAFPDLTSEVEDVFGDNTKMVARYTAHGTHQGEFVGVPATKTRVEVGAMSIYRFSEGQIAEIWTEMDARGLMEQLGEE